ncbi:YjbF family lipoprotein [Vibrio gazogenes]|uniref:Group 4 capsule polysaccharide lipoprotein gfcB, YjbF n=1 Tax=Vibrio gazogenes DSM 21264 = NBRC 103151 TaxID=1123492 RepID=A0A1M5D1A8_VIBGA|nr:YjbF family lipoprotein [Vibrio gazogenes]USP13911.1 YjbF family lipoprotein [Vibrio gazogenes]SHF60572.1 Group 4 capsule polysaccharide lipoprotein gfcB, YjbF [Vibrio gazogenes DSM 21264] [Vibrio gazogenes DSM 21264 = NBRC 103151]SJN56640.1 putative lipoprotein GfcB precursor [Vibrio gazogenes]
MTKFLRFSHYCYLLFFTSLLLLVGCSQNAQDLSDTIQSALWGPDDHSITPDKVAQIPYASVYVRMGENPLALMILTWVETTRSPEHPTIFKWLSTDREMLVTQAGRVIKTVSLKEGNLIHIESNHTDPLVLGLQKDTTPRTWQYKMTWSPGYHTDYQALSTFTVGDVESKHLPNGTQALLHVVEQVDIPQINQQYQNNYWISPHSGEVIASEQYIFPGSEKLTLSLGKRYVGDNHG